MLNAYKVDFDILVVGGGPAGATAATEAARRGYRVALLDRQGRIKPCGGAVPPILMDEFSIPESLLVAKAKSARIIAPSNRSVDMPIEGGYVGMVDRDVFDEWLRKRAATLGAKRLTGRFKRIIRSDDALYPSVEYKASSGELVTISTKMIIAADGARSAIAKTEIKHADRNPCVFAYHEVIDIGQDKMPDNYKADRCDIHYRGDLSPDFYSWIFPHGTTASVGTGSANKGFSLKGSVASLRQITGLDHARTIRCEGAPIPLKPLKYWDNGKDVILAGDAAGVVAPASGEGIYYAMACGKFVSETVMEALETNNPAHLKMARKRFLKIHGKVFWVLGLLQKFWYATDKRRERFTTMCGDPDVQKLTWEAYMNKKLVRSSPLAHVKIFFKDLGHLLGIVSEQGGPKKHSKDSR